MSKNIISVGMENSVLACYEKGFDHGTPIISWKPLELCGALLMNYFLRARFEQIAASLIYCF